MKFAVVLLSVAALAYSSPVPQHEPVLKQVVSSIVDCMNSDFNLCIKEQADRVAEKLRTVRALKITDGFTIINNGPREAKALEPLSDDAQLRNKQVTERLWEKAKDLEVEFSYGGEEDEARGIIAQHKKKKETKNKIKMLIPFLLLAKVKAAALALAFLGIIAISIFKIAVIAKVAFLAKIISIIKALLAKKGGHEEHGWAPVEDHGHGGHGGHGWESQGWGRSKIEASDLAYSAYKTQ